jgi:hypothetical protein
MAINCKFCGSKLIPGLKAFGICAWCMKEIGDQENYLAKLPVPCYGQGESVDKETLEIDYG